MIEFKPRTKPSFSAAVAFLSPLLFAASARAAASGDMPWEGPLQSLVDSFTGITAQLILILAIVSLGFALAFSEGPILRRVLGVILGGAIAATAASFALSFFGFSSGATF